MAEQPEIVRRKATRPTIVLGVRREQDEVFSAPLSAVRLHDEQGYTVPVDDEPEPQQADEAEPEEPEAEESEEQGEQEEAGEAPEWDLKMPPDEYLGRYPEGQHAAKARAVLAARDEDE